MRKKPAEKKTWGTLVAERARAKANTFSDEKRQKLMARGLQLIYGETGHVRAATHRRGH